MDIFPILFCAGKIVRAIEKREETCKGELIEIIKGYGVKSLRPFRNWSFRFGNIHDGLKVARL